MSLLQIVRDLENKTSATILTCDLEIILYLFENPSSCPKKIFGFINYSTTTFYNCLNKLTLMGIISFYKSPEDRRSILYKVEDGFLETCQSTLRMILPGAAQ
jgi:hypothetical protein